MNKREFAKYLKRDGSCVATGLESVGQESDRLIPNHRIDRGMGGSKLLDRPSNIVVMDSIINGLITHDREWVAKAFKYGWSLETWQDPLEEPFFHIGRRQWVQPDDEYHLTPVPTPARIFST